MSFNPENEDRIGVAETERSPQSESVEQGELEAVDVEQTARTSWETLDVTLTIGGNKYYVVTMKIVRDDSDEADRGELKTIPEDSSVTPEYNQSVSVDVSLDAAQSRRTEIHEKTFTIFKGYVTSFRRVGDGSYIVNIGNDDATVKYGKAGARFPELTLISTMAEEIIGEVDVSSSINLTKEPRVEEIVSSAGGPSRATSARGGSIDPQYAASIIDGEAIDFKTKYFSPRKTIAEHLNKFGRWTNSEWYVDKDNVVQMGVPKTTIRQLDYVKDTSDGKKTPPYQSVRVVGSDLVAEEGWEADPMIQDTSQSATVRIENFADEEKNTEFVVGETQEPVFEYKSTSIKTPKHAIETAKSLLYDLVKQTQSGSVTVVGRPDIELYDVIQMPEYLGGYKYIVRGIEHNITGENGFTTSINVGTVPGLSSNTISEDPSSIELDTDRRNTRIDEQLSEREDGDPLIGL